MEWQGAGKRASRPGLAGEGSPTRRAAQPSWQLRSGERWGTPAGRASRPVLDGMGRHAPWKNRKTSGLVKPAPSVGMLVRVSLGPAFPGQVRGRGKINDLAVQMFFVASKVDQGCDV